MTAIERTAYPRFKRNPTRRELEEVYSPTSDEVDWATATAREDVHRLHLLLWLKSFQRLGYFPDLAEIPAPVVNQIRSCLSSLPELQVDSSVQPGYGQDRTLYRHQQAVRDYLQVQTFGDVARQAVITIVQRSALVMDNPADLLNVAIEELVRLRFELPAFSTLDRMVGHVRARVNRALFAQVRSQLTPQEVAQLQALLDTKLTARRTPFQVIKEPPPSATLTHLKEWQNKLTWLLSLGGIDTARLEQLLSGVPPAKIQHFAAEADVLDASTMNDIEPPKRYTLLLCLIQQARVTTRDELVTMLIKRIAGIQQAAQEELVRLREVYRTTTVNVADVLSEILETSIDNPVDEIFGQQVRELIAARGGQAALLEDCASVISYNGNNYLPLTRRFFRPHRRVLFNIVRTLDISSTTQDRSLMQALRFVLANQHHHGEWLPSDPEEVDLSFASELWQRTILVRRKRRWKIARRQLEVCVFIYLAYELKTGDLSVADSEQYADFRTHLLPWEDCAPHLGAYCQELGIPASPKAFVASLKEWLTITAQEVDRSFPENKQLTINSQGEPVLKRPAPKPLSPTLDPLASALQERVPQRNLIDVLRNVEYWTHWSRHFGPLSGSDPKIENPRERYVVTAFTYGCNLGPVQMARHARGRVSPHQLWLANHRHITAKHLDAATRDIINSYSDRSLPRLWGKEKVAAADGTQFALYEDSLMSEYHIRYGGYGGIAYHHLSDTYIALFSHFIVCGVWEAVYILDILKTNTSNIQPDTLHSDTQGQSAPVFGMAHLLGIKLMPRIRNWKDLIFYRHDKKTTYQHIDALFSDTIDWGLIETHWQDLMQVVLSIQAGKVLPSTLLRKLSNYSRKNRLYQAFREVGRVVRTVFLLQYLSDPELRVQITSTTNKLEAYNGFTKWISFGGEGVIGTPDPEEQEKRVKYTDLVANAVILQNTVDLTDALRELAAEGYEIKREDLELLSPYWTRHIKRFGDYVLDWEELPPPLEEDTPLPI